MRTVIFYGLLFIANAIRSNVFTGTAINFILIITFFSIVMDIVDFIKSFSK